MSDKLQFVGLPNEDLDWSAYVSLPDRLLRMRQLQMIHHSIDEMVYHFDDVRRPVIERGHSRDDHRARLPEFQHVLEVNCRKRRLARNDYQLASFFQADVRGAMQTVAARTRGQHA